MIRGTLYAGFPGVSSHPMCKCKEKESVDEVFCLLIEAGFQSERRVPHKVTFGVSCPKRTEFQQAAGR